LPTTQWAATRRAAAKQQTLLQDIADYEAMVIEPEVQTGFRQLMDVTAPRVCIMCAEREPPDCRRCLLVARSLAERGLVIGHILRDGTVERTRRRSSVCSRSIAATATS